MKVLAQKGLQKLQVIDVHLDFFLREVHVQALLHVEPQGAARCDGAVFDWLQSPEISIGIHHPEQDIRPDETGILIGSHSHLLIHQKINTQRPVLIVIPPKGPLSNPWHDILRRKIGHFHPTGFRDNLQKGRPQSDSAPPGITAA
jgi:hypothetical protein